MFDVGCWLLDVLRILQKRDNWIFEISHIQNMKTKNLAALLLCVLALIPSGLRAQTNNLTALLQQGLFEEQANRNLDAAIADYQALARQFDKDRQLAATAVFRLGECYRMQGKTNEAALEYQRILRDFADEQTLATLSRQNLTGMGMSPASAASSSLQTQKDLLAKQITLAEQDLADTQRLAQTGMVPQDKVRNAEREVLRLKQQLAALDSGRADLLDLSSSVKSEEDQEIARIQTMIRNSPDLINAPREGVNADLTPLGNAATHGWIKVATYLLDHGADVNARGGMALVDAARAGNRAMVELLLSRGADVNPKENAGQIPLHVAVQNGFQAVVEVLLANKADVNAQNSSGVTPLFLAAGRDNPRIVSLLLEHKADVNLPDQSGATPLINAAHSGHPENLKLLLAAGANPNVETSAGGNGSAPMQGGFSGRTALSFAAESGSPEMVKMLLAAKADPNGGKLDAPLLCAIDGNDIASAELLLQAGAKPNTIGRFDLLRPPGFSGGRSGRGGRGGFGGGSAGGPLGGFGGALRSVTPLWLAISENQLPMVQLLLKYKADPNDAQTDDRPLLVTALDKPEIVQALLEAGARVDALYSNVAGGNGRNLNWTPLLFAVMANSPANTVEILLKHGANPNARDGAYGQTPLHWMAGWDHQHLPNRKVVELLLDYKADPNVRNDAGLTPLDELKQWSAGNNGVPPNGLPPDQKDSLAQLADLLRQHGALDVLPDWDRITVSRPSAKYSAPIFYKGTNDWNRFTLLDTILNWYQSSHSGFSPAGMLLTMPFPDLARVTILRHTRGSTNEMRIPVNLLNSTNGVDCSKDVPLEFGDVVEIPERNHALGDHPVGLTDSEAKSITDYLKGSVQLVTHDQNVRLSIYPSAAGSELGSVVRQEEAQKVLLSSSDLSRVKVIRRDAKTGKTREWIVDCSPPQSPSNGSTVFSFQSAFGADSQPTSDLWLRDGDVIEVPGK
jgi:ankyrin repeat protein